MLEDSVVDTRTSAPAHVRVGAIVAIALAAGFITWLALRSGSDGKSVSPPAPAVPEIVAPARLRALAATLGHPLYWAGPQAGMRYELTQASGDRIFIRYLPTGAHVGDRRPRFLAIGTYGQQGAFTQIRAASKRPGAVTVRLTGGGLAVYDRARPTSIYFGYPDSDVQVEVYDPSARTARRLVLAGQVVPIR